MALKADIGKIKLPSVHDWGTSDEDEINKRRARAQTEAFEISNLDRRHKIFSTFRVKSASGLSYGVEIRDFEKARHSCDCVDFRINGLGTCKHVEAVLLHLEAFSKRPLAQAMKGGSNRLEVLLDGEGDSLRLSHSLKRLPRELKKWVDEQGRIKGEPGSAVEALDALSRNGLPELRLSREVQEWLAERQRAEDRKRLRREYEQKVHAGEWPAQETTVPLFPYQREGMLHLAFTERALLADEMGLGKTIQAIAACALLHRLGQASRVLVVTPASLKTEWEEQIQRFTGLPYQLLFGPRHERLRAYSEAPFFTIVNYEQMVRDALDVNERLQPDVVVLDEAQRIKNWSTKTTQAIKRLRSRHAFVLTGTPIENRIDELYSLMDFLNPSVLGPLFRFNREFYELDERGRPTGYRNLQKLHDLVAPYMLRRRKAQVETELPDRTDRNHFVPLSNEQKNAYQDHEAAVARLASIAKRRPLTKQEQEKLLRELAMMRMVCDTNYILNPEERECPKLGELEKILEECKQNEDVKIIIFSEWGRMLELVRELCQKLEIGFAWHTGSVPQRRRRGEINAFKNDPGCRVFLSTDSGSTGLNLQNASVVINCDLPWNPAKFEQRIARAWRKHQTRAVTVINLVSENTIEHRMLETLANKQALADGVLDLQGDLGEIKFRSGRQAFLTKLEQMVGPAAKPAGDKEAKPPLPADRARGFAEKARERLQSALVRCEEVYLHEGNHSILMVVVDRDQQTHQPSLAALHEEFFPREQSDPLSPVTLEVIDRATAEALKRLMESGVISVNKRAVRQLFPEQAEQREPLTAEEQAKLQDYRERSARKLKMARLLKEAGMEEEALEPLRETFLWQARGWAIQTRVPEPEKTEEIGEGLFAPCWNEQMPVVREFISNTRTAWGELMTLAEARLAPGR